jgi:hypothetical protein
VYPFIYMCVYVCVCMCMFEDCALMHKRARSDLVSVLFYIHVCVFDVCRLCVDAKKSKIGFGECILLYTCVCMCVCVYVGRLCIDAKRSIHTHTYT